MMIKVTSHKIKVIASNKMTFIDLVYIVYKQDKSLEM